MSSDTGQPCTGFTLWYEPEDIGQLARTISISCGGVFHTADGLAAHEQAIRKDERRKVKEAAAKIADGKICSYMDGNEVEKKARGESYCTDLGAVIRALEGE